MEGFQFGGASEDQQEVYFFNMKEIIDNKFGTVTHKIPVMELLGQIDEESEEAINEYILSANTDMREGKIAAAYAEALKEAAKNSNGAKVD